MPLGMQVITALKSERWDGEILLILDSLRAARPFVALWYGSIR
jgi:hypothetical protein